MSPSILTLMALLAAEPLAAPPGGTFLPRPDTTLVGLQPGEGGAGTPASGELSIYYLSHLPVAEAAQLLIQLADDNVRVIPEPVGNRLLIFADAAGHKGIQNVLVA